MVVPVPAVALISGATLIVELPAEPVAAVVAAVMPEHQSVPVDLEGPVAAVEPDPDITGADITAAAVAAAVEPAAMAVSAVPEVVYPIWVLGVEIPPEMLR